MKLMVCANLDVGGLPAIDLASGKIAKWQEDKIEALAAALGDAKEKGVDACVIAGGLFAKGFVAQSLLSETLEEAGCHDIPVHYAPNAGELADAADRMPQVEGIHIAEPGDDGKTVIVIDAAELVIPIIESTGLDEIDAVARPSGALAIIRNGGDIGVSLADGNEFMRLGPLGPSAFGEKLKSGYLIADVEGGKAASEWVEMATHPFVVHEVVLDGLESSRELVTTVGEAVKGIDRDACLRVELKGRIPLDVYINTVDLAAQLERYFFYVEVVDECALDIDVADLETDVSLLAEFVRQVTGDDSLSETEKTRILRCGWNVLNGKELVE